MQLLNTKDNQNKNILIIDKNIKFLLKKKNYKIIYSRELRTSKILLIKDGKKKKIIKFSNNKKFKNEIKGFKYFKKNNFFKLPRLFQFNISIKSYYHVMEYIAGKKPAYFDLNRIKLNNKKNLKKITIYRYIKLLKNTNQSNIKEKKYKQSKKIIKHISNYFLNMNNLKNIIRVNYSHGDFVNYNIIKKNNKFYIIDYENFKLRTVYSDQINWILHRIFYNLSKLNLLFFLYKKVFFHKILFKFNKFLISSIFKIKINDFFIYYIFYLYEKIEVLNENKNLISNSLEKKRTKNMINIYTQQILQILKIYE